MIFLVLSDIHGNLPALEIVLQKEKYNYDSILSLGDVVNYAPWSNECVQLLDNQPDKILLIGNHEAYFLKGAYSNPGKVSEVFFDTCYPKFTEHKKIELYQSSFQINDVCFIHTIDDKYIFKDTKILIQKKYCIGHSHQQYINELNEFVILNPGSVGQNRGAINIISYSMYNDETNTFSFKEVSYDVDIVINEMISRNYPQVCVDYYLNKKRV